MAKLDLKRGLSPTLNRLGQVLTGNKARAQHFSSTFESDKYVYLVKGQFVNEITFIRKSFDAINRNNLPIEEGIVMANLDSIEAKDPALYQQFLNTGLPAHPWNENAFNLAQKIINAGAAGYNLSDRFIAKVNDLTAKQRAIQVSDNIRLDKESQANLIATLNLNTAMLAKPTAPTSFIVYNTAMLIEFKAVFAPSTNTFTAPSMSSVSGFLGSVINARSRLYANEGIITAPSILFGRKINKAHYEGDTTTIIKAEIAALRAVLDDTTITLSPAARAAMSSAVAEGDIILQDLAPYDKLTFDPRIKDKSNNISEFINNALPELKKLPPHEMLIVVESTPGGAVTSRYAKADVSFSVQNIDLISFETPSQGWTGPKALSAKSMWGKITEALAQNPEVASLVFTSTASSSMLTTLLLHTLDEIFNTKEFSKQIEKGRKRVIFTWRVKIKKKKVLANKSITAAEKQGHIFRSFLKKLNRQKKKKSPMGIMGSAGSTQQTQNIVPLINAELKQYVLEQMTYPSLENRSGRFAGSVRVLSAQENAAVQYTYQKSPYQVFSPSRGKRPWATEERDPAKIIDRAIKKLGQDRFQKVFRTEEV